MTLTSPTNLKNGNEMSSTLSSYGSVGFTEKSFEAGMQWLHPRLISCVIVRFHFHFQVFIFPTECPIFSWFFCSSNTLVRAACDMRQWHCQISYLVKVQTRKLRFGCLHLVLLGVKAKGKSTFENYFRVNSGSLLCTEYFSSFISPCKVP